MSGIGIQISEWYKYRRFYTLTLSKLLAKAEILTALNIDKINLSIV